METLTLITFLLSITITMATNCKIKYVGGYNEQDCVCVGQGIHLIKKSCKNSQKIIATTTRHCYTTEVREIHYHLGDLGENYILFSNEGKVEHFEDSDGVVFLGAQKYRIKIKGKYYCVGNEENNYSVLNQKIEEIIKGCHGIYQSIPMETHKINTDENKCRVKRQAPKATAPAPAAPAAAGNSSSSLPALPPTMSEDAQIIAQTEIGHELMRQQIARYLLATTARLVGLATESRNVESLMKRYPILKLLELAKVVMQKTCAPITPSFFTMATSSFIQLQMESFHLKEPYISYPAFLRIETALKRCIAEAQPHTFYHDKQKPIGGVKATNGTGNGTIKGEELKEEYCEGVNLSTSNRTLRTTPDSTQIYNISIPSYARGFSGNGSSINVNEPLIETVWKILVNAHSYCYTKFSDYYNDHHTFTVSLLPLFSNDVQDVWLGKDSKGYSLSPENILYGGLLGDVAKLLGDVNNCVGASRADGTAYPWFLNRPRKDKSSSWFSVRKRREIEEYCVDEEGSQGLFSC